MLLTKLVSCGAASSLLVASAAFTPESDFYPIIEYWKAGDYRPNPLCGTLETSIKAQSYPSRTSLGLMKLTSELRTVYAESVQGLSTKDLRYTAKQRRKNAVWETLVSGAVKNLIALVRSQPANPAASFAEQFCDTFDPAFKAEDFCFAVGNWSQNNQCLTDYSYTDAASVSSTLTLDSDYGWTAVPEECLRPISANRNPADLQIQQFASTPDLIESSVARSEYPVYYLLLKAIDHLDRWAESEYLTALQQLGGGARAVPRRVERANVGIHDLFKTEKAPEELIPGWHTERVFMMNEPRFMGGPTLRTPYATMSSKGNNLLFVFRRPLTTYDARLALYHQFSFKYLYNFTGEVHDGSSTIFQTLSGVMEFALDNWYESKDLTNIREPLRLIFAGADLPSSGGAAILASHMQRVLCEKFGSCSQIEVAVVTFGKGLISDRSFVEKLRNLVEVRNVIVQGDSTDLFPCAKTFSCDERVLLPRTGIETGKEFDYATLPGRVQIPLAHLARYDAIWGEETTPLQLAAIKDCAYSCFLTQTVCPSDKDARCSPKSCPSFVV